MTPCPRCGFVSSPGAMFCRSCAFRLDGSAAASSGPSAAGAETVPAADIAPPPLVSPPSAPAPPQLPLAGEPNNGWGAPPVETPALQPVAPPIGIAPPPGGFAAPPPANSFLFTGLPVPAEPPAPLVSVPAPEVALPPLLPPAPAPELPLTPAPEPELPLEPAPAPELPPEPEPLQPEPEPVAVLDPDPDPDPVPTPVPQPLPEAPAAAPAAVAETAAAASGPAGEAADEEAADGEADDEVDETVVSDRRSATGWRIVLDGGAQQGVGGQVLVGRRVTSADPRWPAARLLSVADTTKSVSKVHALFEADADTFWVTDLGSTNGVIIALANGSELVLATGVRGDVPAGSDIVLGNYVIKVEKD